MSVSWILDLAAVFILLVCMLIGFKRGFIKSIVGLIGSILAAVIAAFASGPLARWVYNTFLQTRLEELVMEKIGQGVADMAGSLEEQVQAVLASLPEGIRNLLTAYGMSAAPMTGAAQTSDALTPTVMTNFITPLCIAVLQLVVFLVLFLILLLLVCLLGKVLNGIFSHLPLIKQANTFFGGVVGLASGALVLFVLSTALQLYMSLAGADSVVTTAHIEQTYLVRLVMAYNPVIATL